MLVLSDPSCLPAVRLEHNFVFREHQCLVFPMLAYDLYELLKAENFCGVSLKLVRKFAVQILRSLAVLADVGLIHCDLKPGVCVAATPEQS